MTIVKPTDVAANYENPKDIIFGGPRYLVIGEMVDCVRRQERPRCARGRSLRICSKNRPAICGNARRMAS